MRRSYSIFGIAVFVSFGVGACSASCGVGAPRGIVEPTGALLSPFAEGGTVNPNSMPHNGLPSAVLALDAFRKNEALRQKLFAGTLGGLSMYAADPAVASALNDPATRKLMAYITSCALNPGDALTYDPHDGSPSVEWKGGLGLCPAWKSNSGVTCRDVVSSCILARTNALAKRVLISMRGDASFPMPLRSSVPVETQYRKTDPSIADVEDNGVPIPSFQSCPNPLAGDPGVTRSCGWHPLDVGRCVAGTTVTMATPASYCAAGTPVMLRACVGTYGCQSGEIADPSEPYHAWLKDGDPACPSRNGASVTFTCPANGPIVAGHQTGYFSLMMAPQDPKLMSIPAMGPTSIEARVDHAAPAAPFHYPSTEKETFTYEEAAFYGDMSFSTADIKQRQEIQSPLYGTMYACYSETSNTTDDELADRLCGDPSFGHLCFPNTPGPCYPPPAGRCETRLAGVGPSYDQCHEATPTARTWGQPITVYLNNPCDLSNASKGCLLARTPNDCPASGIAGK